MVKSRWPRVIAIVLVIAAVATVGIIIALNYNNLFGPKTPDSLEQTAETTTEVKASSSGGLLVNGTYYIDAYSQVVLRNAGYINAGGLTLLAAGDEVTVKENTPGPMTKVVTKDGMEGYLTDRCLKKKGTPPDLYNTARIEIDPNYPDRFYINQMSSIKIYNGCAKDGSIDSYGVIGYLPHTAAVQIVSMISNNTALIVDQETGIVGYIDISNNQLKDGFSSQPETGKTIDNSEFTDGLVQGTLTVVNTTAAVPFLESPSEGANIQWMIKPGTWLRVDEVSGEYCKVSDYTSTDLTGYIKTSYLYVP